jgi:hypothetical protein
LVDSAWARCSGAHATRHGAAESTRSTVFVYWGDHWDGTFDTTAPGKHNYLATYVFQSPVFSTSTKMLLPTYHANWRLDVGAGTFSAN